MCAQTIAESIIAYSISGSLFTLSNNLLNYINENCAGKRVLVIGHGSVSWALVILLKLLSDPAKDDYKIKSLYEN